MRVVIVGASSGLGRSIGIGLAKRGAHVALLARRVEMLTTAAAEAGKYATAIACDVTHTESVNNAIAAAAQALGGIDGVVYATGIGNVARIEDIDAAEWAHMFATNVIGASLVTAAALNDLKSSGGRAIYLSSISASQTPPWPGLSSYVVSKTALDKLVGAWRAEHPTVGFTRVAVGDCVGGEGDAMTQFANGWNQELLAEFGSIWFTKGYVSGSFIQIDQLVESIDALLRSGASLSIPEITISPRPPAVAAVE